MHLVTQHKGMGLVDRAVIGILLFLILLLVGVQMAKASQPSGSGAVAGREALAQEVPESILR